MTQAPFAIELSGLRKAYGAVTAIDGVNLTIRPGEIVALLGPNGAGKTTTLDAVLGFLAPTAGAVRVFGADPGEAIGAGRICAVLQSDGLLRDLTVGETIELTASLYASARRAGDVLARAGIASLAGRTVAKLSGGEVQRLRFALALLPDPDLLILDEPTTGMDVAGRRALWQAIGADAARGRTVVFATHYLAEADAYAERVVLMAHGRIVADGTPAAIKAAASGRVVRAVLDPAVGGAPGAERVAGELRGRPDVHRVDVAGVRLTIHTSDSDAVARSLLTTTAARDLEIEASNLEDAFVTLTSDAGATRATSATGQLPESEIVR